ncbi:unnamed protein product [Lepeophtheirus salmonis]|uniref:(salmon louse) hypothetical protein n=1 Tax=Lepeophtheirus salmonis TaxID=72036 RepID=A0A7R8HAS4_LEPSM|nr:unnamed protein product [Lepeophtheirus salmonis]CAF2979788.1 unnamed protein product [Lepeophtheirus salmonis]
MQLQQTLLTSIPWCTQNLTEQHHLIRIPVRYRDLGVPQTIHSYQEALFTVSLSKRLGQLLGSSFQFTTWYYLGFNGINKRFNNTLKTYLALRINQESDVWVDVLPFVMFSSEATVIVNQRHWCSQRYEIIGSFNEMKQNPPRVIPEPPARERAPLEALKKSSYVLDRKPSLPPTYLGPFKVLSKSDRTLVWTWDRPLETGFQS